MERGRTAIISILLTRVRNHIHEFETLMNRHDKEVFFVISKSTKVFAESESPSDLQSEEVWEHGTSKERLWNHSFISTIPPFSFARLSIPAMNSLKYAFIVGSNFLRALGLKHGLISRLKKLWRALSLPLVGKIQGLIRFCGDRLGGIGCC